jgi:hypothetical protein
LIDADSFQFQAGGKPIPCGVGAPEFTPPELQGRSLHGVVRTESHDQFGLAVTIFQLLFMGGHPYAGLGGGDLTLGQLIARNLFAYSRNRKFGVAPPMGVITLDEIPNEIANAFERAFGIDPAQRPAAMEWAGLLQGLESRLSRCAMNATHFYPTAARACPWCKIEAASPGVVLFLARPSRPKYAKLPPSNFSAATSLSYPKAPEGIPAGLVAMLIFCGVILTAGLINAISLSQGNQTYANAQYSAPSSISTGSNSTPSSGSADSTSAPSSGSADSTSIPDSALVTGGPAQAATPTPINKFSDWAAQTYDDNGKTLCYATSAPKKQAGNFKNRGNPFIAITHAPQSGVRDQVSYIADYELNPNRDVTLTIGEQSFSLSVLQRDRAWAKDGDTDRAMIEAMRKGSSLTVKGISSRGTEITDTYSLLGFSRAYQAISAACGVTPASNE